MTESIIQSINSLLCLAALTAGLTVDLLCLDTVGWAAGRASSL